MNEAQLKEYQRVCDQRALLIGAITTYGAALRQAINPDRYLLEQRRELIRLVNALEDEREKVISLGSEIDGEGK